MTQCNCCEKDSDIVVKNLVITFNPFDLGERKWSYASVCPDCAKTIIERLEAMVNV